MAPAFPSGNTCFFLQKTGDIKSFHQGIYCQGLSFRKRPDLLVMGQRNWSRTRSKVDEGVAFSKTSFTDGDPRPNSSACHSGSAVRTWGDVVFRHNLTQLRGGARPSCCRYCRASYSAPRILHPLPLGRAAPHPGVFVLSVYFFRRLKQEDTKSSGL